jgi:hypothetical protein
VASRDELTATEIKKNHLEWAQKQPEIGLCVWCPDYRVEGPAEEVAQLNAVHRHGFHPELNGKRRSRRGKSNPGVAFRQNLTPEDVEEIDADRRRRARLLGVDLEN